MKDEVVRTANAMQLIQALCENTLISPDLQVLQQRSKSELLRWHAGA